MPILQVRVAIWAYSPAAHTVKLGSNRLSFSEVQCCPTPSMVWLPGCHQNHVPYSNWNKFRYHHILDKFSTILKTIISHYQPLLTIIYPPFSKLPPYCPQRACPLAAQHASWGRRLLFAMAPSHHFVCLDLSTWRVHNTSQYILYNYIIHKYIYILYIPYNIPYDIPIMPYHAPCLTTAIFICPERTQICWPNKFQADPFSKPFFFVHHFWMRPHQTSCFILIGKILHHHHHHHHQNPK